MVRSDSNFDACRFGETCTPTWIDFTDKVDPYKIAEPVKYPNRSFRAFIPILFDALAMREPGILSEAWLAIITHPAYPAGKQIVTAGDVANERLKAMLERFDAMPFVAGPDGKEFDLADPSVLGEVKAGWLRGGWKDDHLWPPDADPSQYLRRELGDFFREQYQAIVQEGRHADARGDTRDR